MSTTPLSPYAFSSSVIPCSSHSFLYRSHKCPRSPSLLSPSRSMYMTTSSARPSPPSPSALDPHLTSRLSSLDVVITGGTGLIGRHLVSQLLSHQSRVTILTRDVVSTRTLFSAIPNPVKVIRYDASVPSLSAAVAERLRKADVVVNLAGEPVEGERWTDSRKQILWNSRVTGTEKIVKTMREGDGILLSASAVGYYGTSEKRVCLESSEPGQDFLATLAKAWEKPANERKEGRTVVLRIGVVLARGGGALEKMRAVFKAFLGGAPGGGEQWFSWVHVDDVVRIMLNAMVDERWRGVYNATAPEPVKLGKFCEELGRALGRPNWLPVPGGAVKVLMGNEAAELILKGQQVLPKRVMELGFRFNYSNVRSALQNLVAESKE